MVLPSPLVIEKVWLDKHKYDAAERRYYERLGQSSASKLEVGPNGQAISESVCSKPLPDNVISSDPNLNIIDQCVVSDQEVVDDTKASASISVMPGAANVCSKPNGPVCKKNAEAQPDKNETKAICSLSNKSEKKKKSSPSPQKGSPNSKTEAAPKKEQAVCAKDKSNARNNEERLQPNTNVSEQISEVAKLKGYFLQSKTLFPQTDVSLTKGTNVNTIPELSKIAPCPAKSKTPNSVKERNELNSLHPLDKQESTELIIPTDSVVPEEQVKKDLKRKKKNRKERHRDKKGVTQNATPWNSLAGEVAKARQHIKNSLQCIDDIAVTSNNVSIEVTNRLVSLEKENEDLIKRMEAMDARIVALEKSLQSATAAAQAAVASQSANAGKPQQPAKPQPPKPSNDDDDDGVDLFGSDSEDEDAQAAKLKEQRLAEYAARKAKKPTIIAKSSIVLDVKPWDDETDMKLMEAEVRKITHDGLLWGASKLVPLAYGIFKLQISCVVEDDKVSVDWLQETIEGIEDYVQSVDIAAFNKI